MKAFSELYIQLETLKDEGKVAEAFTKYFSVNSREDHLWAIALCLQKTPKKITTLAELKSWVKEEWHIPEWLYEESLLISGDRTETIALLARNNEKTSFTLAECCRNMMSLQKASEEDKQAFVLESWRGLSSSARFIFNKLLTGGFRVTISIRLISKALSSVLDIAENKIANRLSRNWSLSNMNYESILLEDDISDDISTPYPFYLGSAMNVPTPDFESLEDWFIEQKWNGLRCQIIKRHGHVFIWNRSGDLVTDKFPEFEWMKDCAADNFVMDGTIIPVLEKQPISYSTLERRLKLKRVTNKVMEEVPVAFVSYDLIELDGVDIRRLTLMERRSKLEALVEKIKHPEIIWLSAMDNLKSWDEINQIRLDARAKRTGGVVIKHKYSGYEEGRKGQQWIKWKNDLLIISGVLIYVQSEVGRGIAGIKEGTFGVWDNELLVPIGRISLHLPEDDMKALSSWAKTNVIEKFGPVRSVNAVQLFKIGFEEVIASSRHKSGLVLKKPVVLKWQKEKKISKANSLEELKVMIY